MELVNDVFFLKRSFGDDDEEAQEFLNDQERFLRRPVILENKSGTGSTIYTTGLIIDDIMLNLELWNEFEKFEDALEETTTWLSTEEKRYELIRAAASRKP